MIPSPPFAWKNWGPDSYTLTVPGKTLEAERPNRFTFQWGAEDKATKVSFELAEKDGGTVVTLTEDGYKDIPEARAMIMENSNSKKYIYICSAGKNIRGDYRLPPLG
jgi:uncharacterized protein YndB with AHSA1/START domain